MKNKMKRSFGGIVLDSSFRIIIPFTLVYGMYILTHGEFSPGGGFQAGALLAVGIVLVRLIQGADRHSFNVPGRLAVVCCGCGDIYLCGYRLADIVWRWSVPGLHLPAGADA